MKRIGALAAVAAIVLAVVAPSSAMAAAQQGPQTLDDLFDLFNVSDFPADFVIVIDTSGSMSQGDNPPYPAVLDSYGVLIDSIPDGDFVSVVTFDSDPEVVFQSTLNQDSRPAAKTALPDVPDGSHTDIGAAIDATLRRLERADSSDVQTVIFITDGVHDPPEGSAYPETSGPTWDDLRSRAIRVEETHDLTVLGIGLVDGTDVDLLRSVFASPEIVSLPPEQLPDFFEDAVRQSRLARLRFLVDQELEHEVRVRSTVSGELAPTIESHVTLVSSFEKLPVSVVITGVEATDSNGNTVNARAIGDDTVWIDPGMTVDLPILLKPEVSPPHFTVPPETESDEFVIDIDASYTAQPAMLLGRVTAHPLGGEVEGVGFVEAGRSFGWTVTRAVLTALAILLALLIVLWLYRRFLRLPPLVGVFELDMPGLDDNERVIKLRRKKMILDASNVPLAGTAKLKLFTRRGHPGHFWASVEQPPLYEVVTKHRERPVPDVTEIHFGDYRLGNARMKYRARPSSRTRKRTTTTEGQR